MIENGNLAIQIQVQIQYAGRHRYSFKWSRELKKPIYLENGCERSRITSETINLDYDL